MQNVFVKQPHEYKRNIDIIGNARKDAAYFLHLTTKQPLVVCEDFVEKQTAFDGPLGVIDREVLSLTKVKPGNKRKEGTTFTKYVNDVIRTERLISPSLVVYLNPKENHSIISQYISGNIKARAKAKAEMFVAEQEGNETLKAFKDLQQTSMKLNNNALSGAHVSTSTILYNKSAHSTLTSTCRSATSYGNAGNEKFIAGNRHYWSGEIVKSNIISICRLTDLTLLQEAMTTYNLHYPTVDEMMDCITYSTSLYWKDSAQMEEIRFLVNCLSDIERAAFVYIADFYHLAKLNPDFVRSFLGRLSQKMSRPIDDPDGSIKAMDGDMKAFVSLLCAKELKGRSIKQVRDGGENDGVPFPAEPEAYMTIASTAENVRVVLQDYTLLIKALWVTDNMPASIASIPSIIRRTAVTSDTDSTIFTVQHWTNWYVGKDDFSDESLAIAWTMIYLSSQLISHTLAMFSANMGIAPESIHRIAMKNEYAFPVFCLTSRAKHYYAYISAREGNVYKEFEIEQKGVALRNSQVPPSIMKELKNLIRDILDSVMKDGGMTVAEVLKRVVEVEWSIKNSVLSGKYEFMTRKQVKNAESYKDGEKATNFAHYYLWREVFADKYGHTEAPPYSAIKISIDAKNPTEMHAWINRMEDKIIAGKMLEWITKNKRKDLKQVLLPETIIAATGIPQEIIEGINIRKMIFTTMEAFYLVLESVGIFVAKPDNAKNITRLISDYYHPDDFKKALPDKKAA